MMEEQPNESPEELAARITKQVQGVYEILPEVTGMHFTQADQVDSIREKGFVLQGEQLNFVYSFNKGETDEAYGDRLERAKMAGLEHYNVAETLERFREAFSEGLGRYGTEKLYNNSDSPHLSVLEFLLANRGKLPAIVFVDLTGIPITPRHKTRNKLPQGSFVGAEAKKILKIITIDDSDLPVIAEAVEKGGSLEPSFKKILLAKINNWLMPETGGIINRV